MLNTSELPKKEAPEFVTMIDHNGGGVEIPVEQESMIALFKSMGYREANLDTDGEPRE